MMGTPRAFAFFCGDARVMDAEDPVVDYYDAADDPRLRSRTVEETRLIDFSSCRARHADGQVPQAQADGRRRP